MWFTRMESLLCEGCSMKKQNKCKECEQLFEPQYKNDYLCNKCFALEDDPPWDTDED